MTNKKIFLSFVILISLIVFPLIINSQTNTKPLFRLRNDKIKDHFYTSDEVLKNKAVREKGYRFESIIGRVYTQEVEKTVPLHQLYSQKEKNHFYTVRSNYRKLTTRSSNPYKYEGIVGYVYPEEEVGTIPLYRLRNDSQKNHFYTINEKEKDNATKKGYRFERIECYILPANTKTNVTHPIKKTIKVDGKKQWTETGIKLTKGNKIVIEATGTVWANKSVKSTPDGVDRKSWKRYSLIKDSNHEALIGKIGSSGELFYVGSRKIFTAKSDGILYLGVNDKDLKNNSGFYNATINVNGTNSDIKKGKK